MPGASGATLHSTFGNDYQRILFGVEGNPASWLKLAVLAGPDIRQFDPGTPAGFNRNNLLVYWDASVTVLPDKNDTVTLKSTRYEQPAFSSFSMYQDIKTDLSWRHKFNDQFSGQLGFTLYVGDWELPTHRDDWIYTPSAGLTYNYNKHLSIGTVLFLRLGGQQGARERGAAHEQPRIHAPPRFAGREIHVLNGGATNVASLTK